jgi:preprotein translocase subunit SecF
MQFIHDVNIDWLGKTKYFVAFSLLLFVAGGIAWYLDGGLRYGIDFKEGTIVYVRFAERPKIDQIRSGLAAQGLGNSTIQEVHDITRPNANEVMIALEHQGTGDEALDAGKKAILNALNNTFGVQQDAGKQDLNAAGAVSLAEFLARRDPLALGPTAGDRYTELPRAILSYRDTERSGLITSFDDLSKVTGVTSNVVSALKDGFFLGSFAVRNVDIVGPKVGAQLRRQAVLATLYALAGMLVYIAFRFEWIYGAAAVLAVIHDVFITLGFFSIFDYEISLTVIAALLTLVGYSMNDKIVNFDRIRENLRLMRRDPLPVIVNRSINQTLSRTLLTGGPTFISVLVLYLLGGDVLRSFAFALVVGIVVGTYSSVGIAAAIVVAWTGWRGQPAVAAGRR